MAAPLPDWRFVCTDLWTRAARFSHAVGASDGGTPRSDKSGFFFFSDLDPIEEAGPHAEAWWWIYLPLLRHLLNGPQSTAYVIGLGHHLRGAPDAEPKRDWIHFLPADFERPENRDALSHLLLMVSYNASLKMTSDGKVPLLLSTRLLEHFNTPTYMRDGEIPTLTPLVLDLDAQAGNAAALASSSDTGAHSDLTPLASCTSPARYSSILASWAPLRTRIAQIDPTNLYRKQLTAQARDICGPLVDAAVQSRSFDPATPHLPCLSPDQIPAYFRRAYRHAIDERRDTLCRDADIGSMLLGPEMDRSELGYWFSRWIKRDVDPDLGEPSAALLNYSLWLSDLTAKGAEDFGRLVTLLSWLPSRRARQRWTSMVVYLRPSSNYPIPQLVPDIVSSFAGASGFTSAEIAADSEKEGRRERDRFEEYLACQSEQSLLVRRGSMWGVAFGGQWFVVPGWFGWHYLAELLKRAEDRSDDDGDVSAYEVACARTSLIKMPERKKRRGKPKSPSLTNVEDDDFTYFMREVSDIIGEEYSEAVRDDDFNQIVRRCVFDDSEKGRVRWLKIIGAAANLREVRTETQRSNGSNTKSDAPSDASSRAKYSALQERLLTDTSLDKALAICDQVCMQAGLHSSRDIESRVAALHRDHVDRPASELRDAMVQLLFQCRDCVETHDAKVRQATRGRPPTPAEVSDGKAVIAAIKRCVAFLADSTKPVSASRLGRKATIEPFNERTRGAAAELARHLRIPKKGMKEEEKAQLHLCLEIDNCRYSGGLLKADEKEFV